MVYSKSFQEENNITWSIPRVFRKKTILHDLFQEFPGRKQYYMVYSKSCQEKNNIT